MLPMMPFPMRLVHPAMSALPDNCLVKGEHAYESGCCIPDAPDVGAGGALTLQTATFSKICASIRKIIPI